MANRTTNHSAVSLSLHCTQFTLNYNSAALIGLTDNNVRIIGEVKQSSSLPC